MLPTFLVIGAPKSGTTALQAYLSAHPQVCLSSFRDPDYFCQEVGVVDGGPADGLAFSGNYFRGQAWYASLFQPTSATRAIGELSRAYLVASDAPRLIHQALPNCQLVFTLREPVARLYSHYWQERKIGWRLPKFEELARLQHPRFNHYCYTSAYQIHLERFQRYFAPEQMTILLFEDLVEMPGDFVRQLYQAVGVESQFIPPNLRARFNQPGLPRLPGLQRLLIGLSELRWKMDVHREWYDRLSRIGRALIAANSVAAPYPPMPGELRARLIEAFTPTIDYIETLLNRPLPAWRTA